MSVRPRGTQTPDRAGEAFHVIANPIVQITIPGEGREEWLVFLGDDQTGRALEVKAVPIKTGLLVIHAMDLRPKWRRLYEEGKH